MSSETSTERTPGRALPATPQTGLNVTHFYMLLAMVAATAAVMLSHNTHPVALLLLSAAILGTGLVAVAVHRALVGFFNDKSVIERPLGTRARDQLLRDKALVLRSIKELEFDRAMGKVSDADFNALTSQLRAHALSMMQALEREPEPPMFASMPSPTPAPPRESAGECPACGQANDRDARFCKACGARLDAGR